MWAQSVPQCVSLCLNPLSLSVVTCHFVRKEENLSLLHASYRAKHHYLRSPKASETQKS